MVSQTKLGAQTPARIKSMLVKEFANTWQGLQDFVVVCPVGLDAITTNQLRAALQAKNIKMTVVKNSLARLALIELDLPSAGELLDAPSAICYGGESVVDIARELVDWSKKVDTLRLRGAFVEGQVFSVEQLQQLATMPNRSELFTGISTLITAPGRRLASAFLVCAAGIAGAIESLVERLKAAEPAASPEQSKVEESAQPAEVTEPQASAEPQDTAEKQDAAEDASDSVSDQQDSEAQQ